MFVENLKSKTMKKIILLMLFAVLSWQNALSQTFTFEGLNYTVTGVTTVKVANNSGATGAIVIPSNVTYNNSSYAVTSIGEFVFARNITLTSVTIPDSVTTIGRYCFNVCTGLTSVTIGNSVTSIGDGAFKECTGLTSVTIPDSVISIGSSSFNVCTSLTSVTIGNAVTSIGEFAFKECTGLTSVVIPNSVISIGRYSFNVCTSLSTVTIGNSVTSIGDGAFQECTGLTSIICNIVTPLSINSNVFNDVNQSACSLTVPAGSVAAYQATSVWRDFCSYLTENTTTISACDSYTWSNNNQTYTESGIYTGTTTNCLTEVLNLTITPTNFTSDGINYLITSPTTVAVDLNPTASGNVTIPEAVSNDCGAYSVTSIGDNAFQMNRSITSISMPNTITSIGNNAFQYCSGITSVVIPNSVISIGNDSFANNTNLTSVTIPDSVSSIGSAAFGSTGLISITIPNSVTIINSYTFGYCNNLTSVSIPNSVTKISSAAFYNCTGLNTVTIPNSVTTIEGVAFAGCTNLTSVICNIETPLSIEPNVFDGVNQSACSLSVPDSSVAAYYATAVWKNFNPINNCFGLTENPTLISVCDSYTWANTGQMYTTSGTYRGTTTNCVTEVLILFINTPSIPSLSIVDQQCKTVSGYLGLQNQTQTFTAGATGNLDKISLYLGNPNGDASATTLTVQVIEVSGTNGLVLGSQTYTYPAQWGFEYIDFNFSNIAVVKGQQYAFILSTPTVSHGFLGINIYNTYRGGALDFAPSSDMLFDTYVTRSNQSFCQGATLNDLLADGTNVSWYNALNGGDQISSTALLETGTYFASQTENTCESERNAVNVLVNPTTAITSQPAANFICSTVGSNSTFTAVSNAVSPSYTWQYRVATTANSNPEWITITSANAAVYANFNTATLTVTKTALLPATGTQYRVLVTGTCGNATSDLAPLTILSTVKAGTISSTASVCIGSDITLTLGAYAGSSFQWQSAATATGVFANIQGANGTTYTILGATATMDKSYRVIVTNSCNTTTATSAIKTLTVNPTSVGGIVKGGGTICSGSNATLSVSGNTGTIQWQYSLDGVEFKTVPFWKTVATVPTFFNPDNATSFSTAVSTGIAATYIASNITDNTYFRAKITSGACSEVYSNAVQYTIGTAASSGTLTAADATVCSGSGTSLTLTGSVGTIKWLKSTNWTTANPTWTAVTTSTTGTLATGILSVSTAYKAVVTIGTCSTETSQVVPVLVYAAPLAKTITADVTSPTGVSSTLAICTTSSTSKVLTIGGGSIGAIQWQKSTTSTLGFVDIADATETSYTISNPSIGANYFRAKFTNSCGVSVFGTAFTVYYKECVLAKRAANKVVTKVPFEVLAYPNPTSNNFNLALTTSSSEKVEVIVYDAIGRLINKMEVNPTEVSDLQIGDNYPAGFTT